MSAEYRNLPSVDSLLRHPTMQSAPYRRSAEHLVRITRQILSEARLAIADGQRAPTSDALAGRVVARLEEERRPRLRRVINATGVILQTNLGRAPLSPSAIAAVSAVAAGYTNLEFDLEAGERGSRQAAIGQLLREATGAEAGLAVNNNAAAVLLALAALAAGREVLVSRGQLVEIGGGFRIPDVLAQSGATLIEVGTTNRTYARDYSAAINDNTAAILRVHPSNFVQQGFIYQPEITELVALSHDRGLLFLDDLGSGALLDTSTVGLAHEPTVQESIAAGADVVCFSGDKLLGGPQCGLAVGAGAPILAMTRHPLARAVRIDKLSLAALEATLRQHAMGEAGDELPVWQMLRRQVDDLTLIVTAWQRRLGEAGIANRIIAGESTIGGGSLPGETLPTPLLCLASDDATGLARRLRCRNPAIVSRIHRDTLLFDPRTVLPDEGSALVEGIIAAWNAGEGSGQ